MKEGLAARQLLVDAAKADRYPSFFFAVIGALAGAPGRNTSRTRTSMTISMTITPCRWWGPSGTSTSAS